MSMRSKGQFYNVITALTPTRTIFIQHFLLQAISLIELFFRSVTTSAINDGISQEMGVIAQ